MIPIRHDIEVLPADELPKKDEHDYLTISSKGKFGRKRRTLGWTVTETIGTAVINPRGILKVSKSTIVK